MLIHSKTDIDTCNFVFACLQNIAVCKFILPVCVYRLTCSRADMGVGECVYTLADIDFTSKSKTHLGMLTNIESSVADLSFTAQIYL